MHVCHPNKEEMQPFRLHGQYSLPALIDVTISPMHSPFHWLHVAFRIDFKIVIANLKGT